MKIGQIDQNTHTTALKKYLSEVAQAEPLAADEECRMLEMAAKGDAAAIERLTKAYLRKVVAVAKDYRDVEMPFEDIINEGNLGLLNAIYKYKVGGKLSFGAFAGRMIRESIVDALASQNRLVLKPKAGKNVRAKVAKAIREFYQKNERRPDVTELASILSMPAQQVADILNTSHTLRSIDEPLRRGGTMAMADILTSIGIATPDEMLDNEHFRNTLLNAIAKLPEREATVLRLLFGTDGQSLTMAEIAEKMQIKRERVRQIRNSALRKLKKQI